MIWKLIARIVSRPTVRWWLIRRAQRTPYMPILSHDGQDIYMQRWWLFNPYGRDADGEQAPARWPLLPSVRIHHILRPDVDRHLHDHPWNARTVVLAGWYREERPALSSDIDDVDAHGCGLAHYPDGPRVVLHRGAGYTGRLLFGEYHRISALSSGGVYTLFITWGKQGGWGFMVDGVKVPWRDYFAQHAPGEAAR